MRLTDAQALLFIGLMIGGSFIDIPLYRGAVEISVNVGGALVRWHYASTCCCGQTVRERRFAAPQRCGDGRDRFAVSQITEFGPLIGRLSINVAFQYCSRCGGVP